MNDNNEPGLAARAKMLRDEGLALKDEPILTRMSKAAAFGEKTADFLVELAQEIEKLKPYQDEDAAHAQS